MDKDKIKQTLDSVKEQYKLIFYQIFNLCITPNVGWNKIKEDNWSFEDIRAKIFFPLLILNCLAVLFHYLIQPDEIEIQLLVKGIVITFLSSLVNYFLSITATCMVQKYYKVNKNINVVAQLITYPFCLLIICNILEQFIEIFNVLYYLVLVLVLILIWYGVTVQYSELDKSKKSTFSWVILLIILILNSGINFVFNKMMEG